MHATIRCLPLLVLGGTILALAAPVRGDEPAELIRHYTFEDVSLEKPVAENLAGAAAPLAYGGPGKLELVAGRTPQSKAVRLDHGWFEGEAFPVDRAVSVEMWFAKHGPGAELGNGQPSGMLLAQGDGYWSGLRLYTRYPQQTLSFEIGRPQPSHAAGVSADEPAADGPWHHVAATWDGRAMRIYLDGLLVRDEPFDGVYTEPKGRLRIGFAGAGIGSAQLDVDEVSVWSRALSPQEVLQHAYPGAALPATAAEPLAAAVAAVVAEEWPAAGTAFASLADVKDLPAALRAVAVWGGARSVWKQSRLRPATRQYAALYQMPGATPALQAIAVGRCLYSERGVFEATAGRAIYERLVQLPTLSPRELAAARLALAECCMREGDGAGARTQYEAVLAAGVPDGQSTWNLRLQIAHSYLASGDYPGAREKYRELAAAAECPVEYRGNALLCVGHSFFVEKKYAEAAESFARAAATVGLLAHHRWEAGQRAEEMRRAGEGLPARDPAASRVQLPKPPEPGVVLHVAAGAVADGDGSTERPLPTLVAARDALRKLRAEKKIPAGGACVLVSSGVYPVRETLELTEEDSGTADAPIVYRAAPGGVARFTGGVVLQGLAPVADPKIAARLPEAVRQKVRQIDLKGQGIDDLGEVTERGYGRAGYPANPWVDLYVDGRPMQLARWPNEGFLKTGPIHQGRYKSDEGRLSAVFEYEGDRPKQWASMDDIWMFGYWTHLWAANGLKVGAIDTAKHLITAGRPSGSGYREGMPYYFFNILEELDSPGEWYLDRANGILYLYPPEGTADATIELPLIARPLVHMENVSHVTLRGLTFDLGRAEGLVMRGGESNLVAGCTFRRLGTNGVIVSGGHGHGILGCDLCTLGAGGVRMAGGDRKTLTPGDHFMENCLVRDFSRVDRVYAPAVHVDGVGCRVAHNLMHDSPHHAMRVEGYDHRIELNEVHSVVYESDDQSGIDIYGNPAYRGLVIRYNFWHHIGSGRDVAGQAGIRLDDFISSVMMYGNVFYRSSGGHFGGIQIHGGKDNVVDNNLFIDCKFALSFSPWGEKRWLERLGLERTEQAMSRWGVDITKPPHSTRYPDLAKMAENPDRNYLWRNVAVDCGQFSTRDRGANQWMDDVAFARDPGFANPSKRDFELPPDSPLYRRLGFRPIPFDEIGLYNDPYRASWPVTSEITPHYVGE